MVDGSIEHIYSLCTMYMSIHTSHSLVRTTLHFVPFPPSPLLTLHTCTHTAHTTHTHTHTHTHTLHHYTHMHNPLTLNRQHSQQVQQPTFGSSQMGAAGFNPPPQPLYGMQQTYPPQFQPRGVTRTQAGGGHGTSGIIGTGGFQPKREKLDPDYGDLDGEWAEDWGCGIKLVYVGVWGGVGVWVCVRVCVCVCGWV